jgi:hypothetical protein
MNPTSGSHPPHPRDIFLEALEKSAPGERAAFLDGACRENAALRSAVEELLANHREDSFLETPPLSPEIEVELARLKPEDAGDMIGPYKLRERIGEGGFGVVWVADQEHPVRRRVALKIIKMGMDTKEVIARFEQERQALAMMDHPNIAKVLDAGATQHGRPYFVMELVRGVKMTEYCDVRSEPASWHGAQETLSADHTVTDLSPIQAMRLESLNISGTKVADLSVLRTMPLLSLRLHQCPNVVDLSPLKSCTTLEKLTLPTQAKAFEFLRTFPKLALLSFTEDPTAAVPDRTAAKFWEEYDAKNREKR